MASREAPLAYLFFQFFIFSSPLFCWNPIKNHYRRGWKLKFTWILVVFRQFGIISKKESNTENKMLLTLIMYKWCYYLKEDSRSNNTALYSCHIREHHISLHLLALVLLLISLLHLLFLPLVDYSWVERAKGPLVYKYCYCRVC